jgi:hypothetical protein
LNQKFYKSNHYDEQEKLFGSGEMFDHVAAYKAPRWVEMLAEIPTKLGLNKFHTNAVYDVANSMMSMGQHNVWRDHAVRKPQNLQYHV